MTVGGERRLSPTRTSKWPVPYEVAKVPLGRRGGWVIMGEAAATPTS